MPHTRKMLVGSLGWSPDRDNTLQRLHAAGHRRLHTYDVVDDHGFVEAEGSRFIGLQHHDFADRAHPVTEFSLTRQVLGFQVRNLHLRGFLPQIHKSDFISRLDQKIICGEPLIDPDIMDRGRPTVGRQTRTAILPHPDGENEPPSVNSVH